jgi:hypothetical protein
MITVPVQEFAHGDFGPRQITVRHLPDCRDDRAWHALEGGELPGCVSCFGHTSLHAVQARQHVPAGGQGGIEMHSPVERGYRFLGLPLFDVKMPSLLVQSAKIRMVLRELIEHLSRRIRPPEPALRDGRKQQRVALAGNTAQQRIRPYECLVELVSAQQRANSIEFLTERGLIRVGDRQATFRGPWRQQLPIPVFESQNL